MKYFRKICGDKCYLSPINIEDAEQYAEWLNDMEVATRLVVASQQINVFREKQILEDMISNNSQIFAIIDQETDKLIGNCSLMRIDHPDRKAEFGIFIGDKKFWSKGYGSEAARLILDYGFNILNLNNIMLRVFSFNQTAIRAYEKAGFKYMGRRRQACIIAGRKYDEIFMDILAEEFESVYIGKFFPEEG
ncbi:MAG: GNAT family N-acetyltransferase [Candidatus Cloacimonetes bacterium]|nr:GNAT family N-acetyltransferase [Candidatus Cloacimonadota bacterium]